MPFDNTIVFHLVRFIWEAPQIHTIHYKDDALMALRLLETHRVCSLVVDKLRLRATRYFLGM